MVVGSALRLCMGFALGISVDESYAVVMSRHFSLSYYDHPPLLFWIPGLVARMARSEDQFFVRLPFILMFMGTTWALYRVGSVLFGERAGLWSAVALNLTLFFTLNAAGLVLPDGPLLFFSAGAVFFLCRVTVGSAREATGPSCSAFSSLFNWLGFGLFSGLSLLAKYHGGFLILGAFVFLVSSRRHRGWLKRKEPYLAGALAAVVFLPVLVWNASHNWASFRFQMGRAAPLEEGQGTPFLDSIAGQIAWMQPWIWLPMVVVLAQALRRGPKDSARWLLACLATGPIVLFTLFTLLGSRGLPHWQAPGYFMLLPLLGASIAARLDRGDPWARLWVRGSPIALGVILVVLVTHARTGWLEDLAPSLLSKGDPTRDLLQWRELPVRLREWGYPKPGLEMAAVNWADAAKVAYVLGPAVTVFCVGDDPRGFHYEGAPSLIGRDVLLIISRRPGPEPLVKYSPYFDRLQAVGTLPVLRHGREEIAVSVYLGRRFLRPVPASRPL